MFCFGILRFLVFWGGYAASRSLSKALVFFSVFSWVFAFVFFWDLGFFGIVEDLVSLGFGILSFSGFLKGVVFQVLGFLRDRALGQKDANPNGDHRFPNIFPLTKAFFFGLPGTGSHWTQSRWLQFAASRSLERKKQKKPFFVRPNIKQNQTRNKQAAGWSDRSFCIFSGAL